ncbi:MAG: NTP transferase domain-containing protein [Candidatus Aenigmarchaeota archaeon]|nr:NTP transferase domain-containing protein [Candidatus Aenigmarchaeota archaeon]
MKVVILAAGKGTRMLPLTENLPKALVQVNGKPFLYYLLKNLEKAGFTEIGIIVDHKKEMIMEFLKQNSFRATVMTQHSQLGTGHAVKMAVPFVKQENFIVMPCDTLFSVKDLQAMKKDDGFCWVAVKHSEHPEKYGVCITNQNELIAIVEKTRDCTGNLVNTCLIKLTPEIFPALNDIAKSKTGEYYLTDAVTAIGQKHKVKFIELQDEWIEITTPEDITEAEKKLKSGESEI